MYRVQAVWKYQKYGRVGKSMVYICCNNKLCIVCKKYFNDAESRPIFDLLIFTEIIKIKNTIISKF